MQYCYEHLSRDVKKLGDEFPDNAEVGAFVSALRPQLTTAMTLRNIPMSKRQFKKQASQIANLIKEITNKPASHPGIQQRLLQNPSRRPPAAVATRGSVSENGASAHVSVRPAV